MSDQVLLSVPQLQAAPLDYPVPAAQEIGLQTATATFDGSGAAGQFLPALQIIGPGGIVAGTFVNPNSPVAAGGEAEVTFGSFLTGALAGSGYSTIEDEGTALPRETALNFTGAGVTATDDPANGRTDVTIPGGGGGGLTLLKTITLATAGPVDWGNGVNGNIPQTYCDLLIVATCNGATGSGNLGTLYLELNLDTGAAYGWNFEYNNNGSISYDRGVYATAGPTKIGYISSPPEGVAGGTAVQAELLGYSSTTNEKNGWCRCGFPLESGNPRYTSGTFGWSGRSAVSRITLTTNQGNFAAGSRVDFYGRGTA